MTTTMIKTRWMRVNYREYTINHPVIDGRHYYCLSVGRYGELHLHWQDLTDDACAWANNLAYDEDGNLCKCDGCELVNGRELLVKMLERYTDKSGAERVAYCLEQAREAIVYAAELKCGCWSLIKTQPSLTVELNSLIERAVDNWIAAVKAKCNDDYLSRYGI